MEPAPFESRDPQSGGPRFADPSAAGAEVPLIGELKLFLSSPPHRGAQAVGEVDGRCGGM
jgi:hypothetical protein